MGFLSEPTKIDSSSTKCPIYYLGHNFSTPIAKPAPAPLVELYDWILELENKNDIDTLYEIYSTCLGEKYTSEEYYISLTELLTTYYENFSFGELINMDMSFPYNTNKLINKKTKFFFEYIESNKLYMKIKEEQKNKTERHFFLHSISKNHFF